MWSAIAAGGRRGRLVARQVTAALPGHSPSLPSHSSASSAEQGVVPLLLLAPGAARGFYFPRKNWFPWRVRLVHQRQAAVRNKRHIWPRRIDPDEAEIFGKKEDGTQQAFREKGIRLGLKKLTDYAKLMRGRQLQDGIEWVESMGRLKSEPILRLMRKALEECEEKRRWDPARIYIFDAQAQRGSYIKSLRKHSRGHYGLVKAPRHGFMLRVRQMPLEEFFHRLYIFNKVPKTLASDMRIALQQSQVSPQMRKEWAPYLCASSRMRHRLDLKWMDSTRQFDYYQARREWIQQYRANQMRATAQAREERGLPPLPMVE